VLLNGPEEEAAFERELANELACPLGQVGRVRPADVLAARADAGFRAPGARRELPGMAAPKTLDRERLHVALVGSGTFGPDPERGMPL
jgi:hypothetical protein